jgi:sterile alpha motif and leucine zipper-containing kinase AZK
MAGNFFIVTEYLPKGDLEKMLHDPNIQLSLYTRMKMAKDAALGMNWLHCSNPPIIHRDLKTSNLLVDENGRVKGND